MARWSKKRNRWVFEKPDKGFPDPKFHRIYKVDHYPNGDIWLHAEFLHESGENVYGIFELQGWGWPPQKERDEYHASSAWGSQGEFGIHVIDICNEPAPKVAKLK